jgi:hypothetical protein
MASNFVSTENKLGVLKNKEISGGGGSFLLSGEVNIRGEKWGQQGANARLNAIEVQLKNLRTEITKNSEAIKKIDEEIDKEPDEGKRNDLRGKKTNRETRLKAEQNRLGALENERQTVKHRIAAQQKQKPKTEKSADKKPADSQQEAKPEPESKFQVSSFIKNISITYNAHGELKQLNPQQKARFYGLYTNFKSNHPELKHDIESFVLFIEKVKLSAELRNFVAGGNMNNIFIDDKWYVKAAKTTKRADVLDVVQMKIGTMRKDAKTAFFEMLKNSAKDAMKEGMPIPWGLGMLLRLAPILLLKKEQPYQPIASSKHYATPQKPYR